MVTGSFTIHQFANFQGECDYQNTWSSKEDGGHTLMRSQQQWPRAQSSRAVGRPAEEQLAVMAAGKQALFLQCCSRRPVPTLMQEPSSNSVDH